MKKINKNVFKRLLKGNKLTIVKFCHDIGISRNTVNNWINRKNGNIADWKVELIEEYFIETLGHCPEDLFY